MVVMHVADLVTVMGRCHSVANAVNSKTKQMEPLKVDLMPKFLNWVSRYVSRHPRFRGGLAPTGATLHDL